MDTPSPKKKIVYKVVPHKVIVNPPKKPNNGSKPEPEDIIPPQNYKRGFLSKCIDVVKGDIRAKVLRTKATVEETPVGWDDYVKFLELAKKGK